jgi:hypothetical protein
LYLPRGSLLQEICPPGPQLAASGFSTSGPAGCLRFEQLCYNAGARLPHPAVDREALTWLADDARSKRVAPRSIPHRPGWRRATQNLPGETVSSYGTIDQFSNVTWLCTLSPLQHSPLMRFTEVPDTSKFAELASAFLK